MGRQQGSLLIEIMISMAIGIFLMTGALQVLLTTKQNFLARETLTSVETNGSLAMDLLASEIRMAGYRGCAAANRDVLIGTSSLNGYYSAASLDVNIGIRGWEYNNTDINSTLNPENWVQTSSFNSRNWLTGGVDTAQAATAGKSTSGADFTIAKESDVLRLWSVEPYVMDIQSATDTSLTANPATMTNFPDSSDSTPERLLIVYDCETTVLVKATRFNHSSGTVTLSDTIPSVTSLLATMNSPQAMMLRMVQYSLEIPSYTNRPSLYRRELKVDGDFKQKVEVLPGVINMQVLYGENLYGSTNANAYLRANEVSDWRKVVSVRLWILTESANDMVIPASSPVVYYGNTYTINDRRIRREFMMTVTLRNRALGDWS